MKNSPSCFVLLTLAAAIGCGTVVSQTASWTGAGFDTAWNNPANWDLGTPAEGTNAIIFGGAIVDYGAPMAATSFAGVNNGGTLNISAAGFNINAAGLSAYSAGAPSLLQVNSGGVMVATNSGAIALPTGSEIAVEGGVLIITNSTGNIAFGLNGNNAGAGFTNHGGTVVFSQLFQSRGRYSRFEQHGGTLSFLGGGGIFEGSNDQERKFLINGGTANLGDFTIGRTLNTVGSAGLVISNGNVNTTSLVVGNGIAAGGATVYGGTLTNTGTFLIADRTNAATTGQRRVIFYVRGGTVVSTDASGIVVGNRPNVSNTGGSGVFGGFLDISSGLLMAEKLTLNGVDAVTNSHATLTLSGSGQLYLGAGGLVGNVGYSNTSYTMTFNGGMLGAMADFSIVGNGSLGGTFTVKAADPANTARNITHTGVWSGSGALVKTGGGNLTLASNSTYSGATLIEAGTLALGVNGSIANSPTITLASGASFDVSGKGGYVFGTSRTLTGLGSVIGDVAPSAGATVNPGSNAVNGTLTFSNSVTQTGGVINHFDLSANPAGPDNDLLVVSADLNVSGVNTIEIVGGGAAGSVYPLINYGGSFNGAIGNFNLSGASGSLSNNAANKTIYLVVTATVRGPTSVTWLGNPGVNTWDLLNVTNWSNGGVLDYFVTGDDVLFSAAGAANPIVTIVGNVAPGSVTVGAPTGYTFGGDGSITGSGGLVKTDTGTLTIQNTNAYAGATVLGGGVVEVSLLANGGFPSSIGDSTAVAANLVFNGGALRYTGGSVVTDRGATLNVDGGTIDVAAGGVTLTASGSLTGDGGLTKAGAGTLALGGANNYTNGTVINAGVFQANSTTGAGTGGITNNAATLRIGVSGTVTLPNVMSVNGNATVDLNNVSGDAHLTGAWSGSGTVNVINQQNSSRTFTMGGNGSGGGHMYEFLGSVNMGTNSGSLRFNDGGGSPNLGGTNVTIDLGTGSATFLVRNGGVKIDVGELRGGPNTLVRGRASGNSGTVTYSIGAKGVDSTFEGSILDSTVAGNLTAITKVGPGKLTLTGSSTYSGDTMIYEGEVQLDGAISATPFVSVYGGALSGSGTVGGAVAIQPNAILSPGDSGIGQMTMSGNLTLQFGSTNVMEINKTTGASDSIVGLQYVIYGGTLVLSNLSGTLADGDVFKLFDAVPGTYYGDFNFYVLPALGPDQYWDTSQLMVDGTIRVFTPRPIIQSFGIDGSNFFLNGTSGGNTSTYFIVLTSPDASVPLAGWTPILTNTFDANGNFAYTNAVNPNEPQRYYLLKTP